MSEKKQTRRARRASSDLVRWGRRATKILDQTTAMVGVLDGTRDGDQYWQMAVQVGRCLLEGKPLLLIAPQGFVVPERLKAAATAVEYYIDGDQGSVEAACKRAFETLGVFVKH